MTLSQLQLAVTALPPIDNSRGTQLPLQRLVGIVPLGIGLTVLAGVWFSGFGLVGGPFGDPFDGPPLFFKVFFSFIAIGFILQGLLMLTTDAMFPQGRIRELWAKQLEALFKHQDEVQAPKAGEYACSNCRAPLGTQADVSPLGDVRCKHCGNWFNIHGRSR
ncbi:hypothetical protein [Planctomicrobium sp. SH527]|uniref:hypothetical protein n=1 Tax=Planctomicrobium sp. SH527 TaxID=3448123 RepID=UPI003F5CA777